MTREAELIRALAEDLALEILTSYTSADDFEDVDFSSLGKAAVYLEEHGEGPGPALQELIAKVQSAAGSPAEENVGPAPQSPPIIGEP
jgi:hypothetical protein